MGARSSERHSPCRIKDASVLEQNPFEAGMLADDEEEVTTTDGECTCQFCEVQAGDIEVKDMIPSSSRSAM